jgi:hypothetical protein
MNHLNNDNPNMDPQGPDPKLNRAGNKNPFGTEASYFDRFNEKLMDRVAGYEELRSEAPLLSSIPKYNPYEIPAGYFDDLPSRVQEQCKVSSQLVFSEWIRMIFRPGFAFPVLTVILVAFAAIHYTGQQQEEILVAEEISIDEQLQTIDEATIIDALASSSSANEADVDPENETIKEYLIDQRISY